MSAFILVDNENLAIVKAAPTMDQALYWAELLLPCSDFLVTGTTTRDYSCYTQYELRRLYHKATGTMPSDDIAYNKLIAGVVHFVENMPLDETSLADLKAQFGGKELPEVSHTPSPEGASKSRGKAPTSSKPPVRPKEGTATGKVWAIADELQDRDAVIARCVAEGINSSTAATQFSKWKRLQGSNS